METLTKLFKTRLDAFHEGTDPRPSTFGLRATGDPNLIRQLRLGRSPRLATADRILAFMDACDEAHVDQVSSRSDPLRDASPREWRGGPMTRKTAQEVEVPTRIVGLPDVLARTGLSRSSIYARVVDGSFPKPVGWIEEEVDEWIRRQIAMGSGDAA